MNKTTPQSAREVIGEFLQLRAIEVNKTVYRLSVESGLIQTQIHDVFKGNRNYTIDTLFKLIAALDIYVFFGEKNKGDKVFSVDDMMESMRKNNPET